MLQTRFKHFIQTFDSVFMFFPPRWEIPRKDLFFPRVVLSTVFTNPAIKPFIACHKFDLDNIFKVTIFLPFGILKVALSSLGLEVFYHVWINLSKNYQTYINQMRYSQGYNSGIQVAYNYRLNLLIYIVPFLYTIAMK